jgi:hypothetical protein
MFDIVHRGVRVGVCSAPHTAHPEEIQVGYVLLDGEASDRVSFRMPGTPDPWADENEFTLIEPGGGKVYGRCHVSRFARAFHTEGRKCSIYEDVSIQFLLHREEAA